MSDLTDGLAALTQQRAKATAKRKPRDGGARELLPPRHPAKAVSHRRGWVTRLGWPLHRRRCRCAG